MKTESRNDSPLPPRFLRFIVEKTLPRAIRRVYMEALDTEYQSVPQFVPESAATVAAGYLVQAIGAFNKTAFVAEIAAVVFCFASASLPLPLFIVLAAVLGGLTLRDAYTHPFPKDPEAGGKQGTEPKYPLDSAGDAAITAVFLLASQSLMARVSPALTVPSDVLFRGALICLPLLATLRMVLRPKPDKKKPFDGSNKSAEEIYDMTRRLNVLWMTACLFTIRYNPYALPASLQGEPFLLEFIPIVTFGLWFRLQQDPFARDNRIETLFRHWKKTDQGRKKEMTMKGVDRKDPLYRWFVGLEVLFFIQMAMPLAIGIWPWLSGREADVDFLRLGFNTVSFAALLSSWNYVKNANRATALALEQEIRASSPWRSLWGHDTPIRHPRSDLLNATGEG